MDEIIVVNTVKSSHGHGNAAWVLLTECNHEVREPTEVSALIPDIGFSFTKGNWNIKFYHAITYGYYIDRV